MFLYDLWTISIKLLKPARCIIVLFLGNNFQRFSHEKRDLMLG